MYTWLTEGTLTAEKARRAIMGGLILVNGIIEDKPGFQVDTEAELEVKGNPHPYVSREGLSLKRQLMSSKLI